MFYITTKSHLVISGGIFGYCFLPNSMIKMVQALQNRLPYCLNTNFRKKDNYRSILLKDGSKITFSDMRLLGVMGDIKQVDTLTL